MNEEVLRKMIKNDKNRVRLFYLIHQRIDNIMQDERVRFLLILALEGVVHIAAGTLRSMKVEKQRTNTVLVSHHIQSHFLDYASIDQACTL